MIYTTYIDIPYIVYIYGYIYSPLGRAGSSVGHFLLFFQFQELLEVNPEMDAVASWCCFTVVEFWWITLQEIHISHPGEVWKLIDSNMPFLGGYVNSLEGSSKF